MKRLRLVLGDQLSRGISSLRDVDPSRDTILMVEVRDEATYVKHHKQKIVFILAAMRHFAESLRNEGLDVDYIRLDDSLNSGSFTGELRRSIQRHRPAAVVATETGEFRVLEMMKSWQKDLAVPVEIREDDRFLCSKTEFNAWAKGRKSLRMEYFYREMRRKTGWLMSGKDPEGGQWNYDTSNRKPIPESLAIPVRQKVDPDPITRDVTRLVSELFPNHFGDLNDFRWAVTRSEARSELQDFVVRFLPYFGDYQDAMKSGGDFLFHSLLSPYLNVGLLDPREACEAALDAYRSGHAPLAAVEGFIRQILGWREFVRGLYWHLMPDYAETNFLKAERPLPEFYWTGKTDLACIKETVESTRRNAYAHHIQRLMITGNFALLAGISPAEVEAWYLAVYADAFEWVELPNTHGMALFADGGVMASKPYAASGSYINRMSDYCKTCTFSPAVKLGPRACPFNYLYWNFLMKNEDLLRSNPRMAFPYRNLDRMDQERKSAIRTSAEQFLTRLETH